MKIVISGSVFSASMTGIGANAKNIVDAIIKYRPDIDVTILMHRPFHANFREWGANLGDKVVFCPLISKKIPTTLWFDFYIWYKLKKMEADFFLSLTTHYPLISYSKTKTIILVHDMVTKEFTDTMEWKNKLMSYLIFDRSIKKTEMIWANSQYTKKSLCSYYNLRENKNIFVGISVEEVFTSRIISREKKEYYSKLLGFKDEFVLFVGSIEPRKNLQYLLKIAPKIYEKTGCQTLIVGANQWGRTHDDYDKDAVVFVKRFIETDDLVNLYNMAACYVSTSLNEGFGMPQLEAMKCGCPVVSPNNSAMTEVVSGYGTLVDGWAEDIWVDAIINEMKRPHVPFVGEKYNWKHIIDGFIDFCKS